MITQQSIEVHSYHIWEQEGRPHGRHLDHWIRAETELGSAVIVEAAPKPASKAAPKKAAAAAKKTSTVSDVARKPATRTTKKKST